MRQIIDNHLEGCNVERYIGGNQTNNYILMFQDNEREFVVTHNANIKPVSYFTGRKTELQDLRQRVEDGRKSVLVSGMGGIGKTHICRKLFEEYLGKYAKDEKVPFQHIGYIEYGGDMDGSLQNCLKFKQQDSSEQNREAAWKELEYLASDGKLLLFVDNVDKPMSDDPGLQRLRNIPGAVILTSRQTSIGDEFEPYRIGFLSIEQCREIYEKIRFEDSSREVNLEDTPDLEYIIEQLAGRHTITVEFLAHLARTKCWTVKRLKEELEQKGFKLQFYKNGEHVNIQQTYEVLYDLSALTEAEQNILEAFSVFPYIPLEAGICNQCLLVDAGVGEDDDILSELYQKGWLQFDTEQEGYALHPVFSQFIYEKSKPSVKTHHGLIKAFKKYIEIPKNGSVLNCQKFIPFAKNMIEKLNMEKDINQVSFISDIAHLQYCLAEYKDAEKLYEKILQIRKKNLGEKHPDTATSYDNLANVYVRQGEYQKAVNLYEKSLQISKRTLGEQHLDTIERYNCLAQAYMRQGEDKKMMKLSEKCLQLSKKVPRKYNMITDAWTYMCKGEYRKAEKLYEDSLCIVEDILGAGHPSISVIYENLETVYMHQRKYEKAEKLFESRLCKMERILGTEHPDTAKVYASLAKVYIGQGSYEKAEELCKKCLCKMEKVLGTEHPDTAMIYADLAHEYTKQGKYETAEELYEKCLCIMEKVFGKESMNMAMIYGDLAMMYCFQGKYEKTLSYFLKAYRIEVTKFGSNYSTTKTIFENMEKIYSKLSLNDDFKVWLDKNLRNHK